MGRRMLSLRTCKGEICERLEKDCVNQVHKPRKKRQSKPSKTAQLEERLNSLVDLLKATNSGDVPASVRTSPDIRTDVLGVPTDTDSAASTRRKRPSECSLGVNASSGAPSELLRVIPRTYNEYAPPSCICRAQVGDVPVPLESDEVLLSTFVNKLMPEYPFVTLRPGITIAELASTKPFLFTTIKMVASYRNLRSMRAQNYLITRHISEQVMLRSERSLEMLQAILLVLGYYHYHCMMHAQMGNLTALANSLAADLGINRAPELQERTRLLLPNPEVPRARTNDERRALCGVWYMNSIVSLAFQRLDPVRYPPYLSQCLSELEVHKEYESDLFLVNLVRIQHLTERISRLHAKDHVEDDLPGVARAPTNVYLNAFQGELDRYKNGLPRHLRTNKLLICHVNSATLRLWEPPVIDTSLLEKISNSFQTMTLGPSYAPQLDIFYRSNTALKTWFQFWLSIDAADYFVMPMSACAQLINAVTMLSRWAKLSSPDVGYGQAPGMTTSSSAAQNAIDPSSTAPSPTETPMYRHPDPTIPAAVSAIKAHFLAQPELQIDILGILQAMVTRFESARREVGQRQGGTWENNMWELAAKKISLTRLKLERWADIVASMGGEALLNRSRYDHHHHSEDGSTPEEEEDLSEPSVEKSYPIEGLEAVCHTHPPQAHGLPAMPPHQEGWQPSQSWANDLFDGLGLDQNFFFDGPGDYGTVVLNSLGPGNI
ncbi:hypothetical protein DL766_005384 [Monosporascus sp. MC13-8B]|uniref:Transcription factor domain-containing protein n=1 Tax=Monosporascus cannonballus TaxID=155416 RepID=A0ABY0HCK5_9PEZI|nr:hypothetical protein DL763_010850 [Monosporascus cannonballus]RYO87265.1 hypothetical protein DL762_004310 [Monosporascus cannonballus]RYP29426.1 hypothetical protein DL766_005384 [Monosporascus sp. MC13-8B]